MKFWENEKRTKNFEHLKAEPAVAKAPNQVWDASTMAGRHFKFAQFAEFVVHIGAKVGGTLANFLTLGT